MSDKINLSQTALSAAAEKITKQHSAYWMGQSAKDLARYVQAGSLDYIHRLRSIQRGVADLVKIVTGKDIPVNFSSGQQSYSDGKEVILSASIDPTKIDILAGLALHEATHVSESQQLFKFLGGDFTDAVHHMLENSISSTNIRKNATRLGITTDRIKQDIHSIMNILEDRRIDIIQYQKSPGYRPYYDASYAEFFHSDEITNALKSGMWNETAVDNYEMHVMNITNPAWDAKDLPALDQIRKLVNLTEAGLLARGDGDDWESYRINFKDLDKFPKIYKDAVKIVDIMYENSTHVKMQNQPQQPNGDEQSSESDLDNFDIPKVNDVNKELERQRKFVNHTIAKDEIDSSSKASIDQLNTTNAQIKEIEGEFLPRNVKAKVIIYRDITKNLILNGAAPFPFRYGYGRVNAKMSEALSKGVKMGQRLARDLTIMNDESVLIYNHQRHGRLDKRRIAALGSGEVDVFSMSRVERKKPANVWIDIDFSGSMSESNKATNAMAIAVAIAYAAEQTRTLNTTIALRDGNGDAANVAIIYDSRRHQFSQLRGVVPLLNVGGSTPETLCFEAIKDEMLKMYDGERKYFINLSDGLPAYGVRYQGRHYDYGIVAAVPHARRLMREFEDAGIGVLSYYIGESSQEDPSFRKMYGQNSVFINPANIASIARTINNLLLKD